MTENTSLFIGEDEEMEIRHRAVFEDDSSSGSEWGVEHNIHGNKGRISAPKASADEPEDYTTIYCICRKISEGFMVGCDGGCDDWFHGKCIGIEEKQKDELKHFVCPDCTKNGRGVTLWHHTPEQAEDTMGNGESDQEVSRSNVVLSKHILSHKRSASQPLLPATATFKKHIARSKLRAQVNPVQQAPAPLTYAAARQIPIGEKFKYSLPTWENRPPGTRHRFNDYDEEDEDDDGNSGDDGNDGDNNSDNPRRGRGVRRDSVLAASTRNRAAKIQGSRRSYIDVEEAPTCVDKLVKESLEQALFGKQDD